MKVSPIASETNLCRLEIELTWDVAQALYDAGPALITALGQVLRQRQVERAARVEASARLDRELAENKAQWSAMAAECAAEIARRANSPSAKSGLIRQLAAERGVTVGFLRTVLRVYGKSNARALSHQARVLQVKHWEQQGLTQLQIAGKLGISARQVRKCLVKAREVRS